MMHENLFYDLLSKKLSGDATQEQLLQLEQLLLDNPEWQIVFDEMVKPGFIYHKETIDQAYATHAAKMQIEGKWESANPESPDKNTNIFHVSSKFKWIYPSIAATIVLAIGILWAINNAKNTPHLNEVTTKRGSRSNVVLPDGTQVWLNTESKITYNNHFGEQKREVYLTGEAYFDVTHDKQHPFIIHTSNTNIKVLGTAFNVRNYPTDKAVEATLMRGKIEVTLDNRPENVMVLKPLEKIIIQKGDNSKSVIQDKGTAISKLDGVDQITKVTLTSVTYNQQDSMIAETGWIEDKLVFINQPLEKIAKELERRFDVSIIFKTPQAKNFRYTAVFKTENLSEILHIFKLSKNIKYQIVDKKIIIE